MNGAAVVVGSGVLIGILSAVLGCGAVLAANAWQSANRTADFFRGVLGESALWHGSSVYYRWMGGVMMVLAAIGMMACLDWVLGARAA